MAEHTDVSVEDIRLYNYLLIQRTCIFLTIFRKLFIARTQYSSSIIIITCLFQLLKTLPPLQKQIDALLEFDVSMKLLVADLYVHIT